ncbi:hypothetical protein GCM10010340_38530 [Streptomyces griseoloalbus]|nr:hypothetical protein GCM10010340_38530 [Streptomyces albaduncus]
MTPPPVRFGDAGTQRRAMSDVTATTATGIQNSRRWSRAVTIGPAAAMPTPPPAAITADRSLMLPLTSDAAASGTPVAVGSGRGTVGVGRAVRAGQGPWRKVVRGGAEDGYGV